MSRRSSLLCSSEVCFHLSQILAGIYPIAQLQEPYTPVGYLAQWLPVVKILKLDKLEQETPKYSALDICEGRSLSSRKREKSKLDCSLGTEAWISNGKSRSSGRLPSSQPYSSASIGRSNQSVSSPTRFHQRERLVVIQYSANKPSHLSFRTMARGPACTRTRATDSTSCGQAERSR